MTLGMEMKFATMRGLIVFLLANLLAATATVCVVTVLPVVAFAADMYVHSGTCHVPSLAIWFGLCTMAGAAAVAVFFLTTAVLLGIRRYLSYSWWVPLVLAYPVAFSVITMLGPSAFADSPSWIFWAVGVAPVVAFWVYWTVCFGFLEAMRRSNNASTKPQQPAGADGIPPAQP